MKVLHVTPTYFPAVRYGGPIYSVHGLCKALADAGHEVHVFTTNVDGPGESNVPTNRPVPMDGIHVHYFKSGGLRRVYASAAMHAALRRRVAEFDIVHLHSVFLWPTWAASRAAQRARVPYVVAPRGMLMHDLIERKSSFIKRLWIGLIERRTLERASCIHATSELEADEMRRLNFNIKKIAVVPNGVNTAVEYKAESVEPNKSQSVLFLGRISWKKGLDRLIRAFPLVRNSMLVIAGNDENGYTHELKRLVLRLGLEGRVSFVGAVYGDEKNRLLRAASVVVLPSYSENFGNVVLEAMAASRPVVVTEEVGLSKMVRECGAGEVCKGSPESISAALNRLLSDPQAMRSMGERGRRSVLLNYTWEVVTKKCVDLYREICDSQNR